MVSSVMRLQYALLHVLSSSLTLCWIAAKRYFKLRAGGPYPWENLRIDRHSLSLTLNFLGCELNLSYFLGFNIGFREHKVVYLFRASKIRRASFKP